MPWHAADNDVGLHAHTWPEPHAKFEPKRELHEPATVSQFTATPHVFITVPQRSDAHVDDGGGFQHNGRYELRMAASPDGSPLPSTATTAADNDGCVVTGALGAVHRKNHD